MQATVPRLHVSVITSKDGPMWAVKSENPDLVEFNPSESTVTVNLQLQRSLTGKYEGAHYTQTQTVLPRIASVVNFPDISEMDIMRDASAKLLYAAREALPTFAVEQLGGTTHHFEWRDYTNGVPLVKAMFAANREFEAAQKRAWCQQVQSLVANEKVDRCELAEWITRTMHSASEFTQVTVRS